MRVVLLLTILLLTLACAGEPEVIYIVLTPTPVPTPTDVATATRAPTPTPAPAGAATPGPTPPDAECWALYNSIDLVSRRHEDLPLDEQRAAIYADMERKWFSKTEVNELFAHCGASPHRR